MTIDLVTFGCRLNTYESEAMRALAAEAGHSDVVIINTCAVTSEAERQARQAIRRARRERPDAAIIVTGCAAQIHPDRFAEMPEVTRVLGNHEKLQALSWAPDASERVVVGDIMSVRDTAPHLVDHFEGRARAFVQVQQGCDHRCTFCVIPLGRGNSRSVPIGAIVEQIRHLVANGYREVVLTGVDITSYGSDLPGTPRLGSLVRRLLALVPDLARLRLSSLDPAEIDEDLWRALAEEPRLMPHWHLSLQAGADLILKRMKRRHSRDQAIAVAARARALRPEIVFGADLIAGFPTETEDHFSDSLALVEEIGLVHLHIFPYSPRPGTPAAKMPQVPGGEIRDRAARLRAAGASAYDRFLDGEIGKEAVVLIERNHTGHTERFAPVQVGDAEEGTLHTVRIVGREGARLVAG